MVIGIETEGRHIHLVFVEAKYRSGLSSEEDEGELPNDQLARELDSLDRISPVNLRWSPEITVASRTLLFVTQDMGMPWTVIARSLAEYRRKRDKQGDIYWTSWRSLQPILEKGLTQENFPQSIVVMEDMLKLLLRKGLTVFRGVNPIIVYCELPQFYNVAPRIYIWPSVSENIALSYKYEVKTND